MISNALNCEEVLSVFKLLLATGKKGSAVPLAEPGQPRAFMRLSKNVLRWWSAWIMVDSVVAPAPAQLTGQRSACIQRLVLIFQVSGHHTFYPFGSETELGPQIL